MSNKKLIRRTAFVIVMLSVCALFCLVGVNSADALYGDVNGDGKVKGNDATLLLKYLADWQMDIKEENADCNGDGKVRGNDATALLKYLAGWDIVLGPEVEHWYDDAIIMDIDCDWAGIYLAGSVDEADIYKHSDTYFNFIGRTKVTDITICAFQQTSYVESETMDSVYENIKDAYENKGLTEFESLYNKLMPTYEKLTETGVDWLQMAIDDCNDHNIRPWVYLRMDDRHYIKTENHPFHDSFFYEAKKNGWLIGHSDIYGADVALQYDYSNKEVRDWMLSYIRELVTKYDCYGFELDFMRRIECFDYVNNKDCAAVMTQFIRDVRAILDEGEVIHGHELKLLVRVGPSVEDNLTYGFDVKTWAAEKLVDVIVPAGHDDWCDTEINVKEWKRAVGNDVGVIVGFDMNLLTYKNQMNERHVKAIAAGLYTDGCDGFYYENYYQLGSAGPFNVLKYGCTDMTSGIRTYVPVGRELVPVGKSPIRFTAFSPNSTGERERTFTVRAGKITSDNYVYVAVGFNSVDGYEAAPSVTLDGKSPVEKLEGRIFEDKTVGAGRAPNSDTNALTSASYIVYYRFENITAANGNTIKVTLPKDYRLTVVYADLTVSDTPLSLLSSK